MTLETGLTQPFNCIKKNVPNIKAQILGNNGLKDMLAFRTNMPGDNQVRVSATKGSLSYIRGNDVLCNHAAVCGKQNLRSDVNKPQKAHSHTVTGYESTEP